MIDQCLLRYHYRYNRRFIGDDSNKDALNFGSFVHKIFEESYKTDDINEYRKWAKDLKETYHIPYSYTKLTETCIHNFLKFNSKLEGETIGVELSVELELAKDMKFIGYIDRVVKGKDGGYLVIDYKTSKREKTKVQLFDDPQLQGYCWAIHEMFGVPYDKIICGLYYPRTNNFVHVKFNRGQILKWKKKQIDTMWRVRKLKKDDIRARRNEFCNWCQFQSMCPEFKSNEEIKCRVLQEEKILKEKKAKKS